MAPKKPKKKLSPYNRHVQKQMKAGKSMKQAAASWSKTSGKPKAASRSSPKKKTSNPKGGKSTMGKKSGFNTQKIFKYVRIGALAAPGLGVALGPEPPLEKLYKAMHIYFGIRPGWKFSWSKLAEGWTPYVAASAVTYGIPKLISMIRSF